MDDLHEIKSMLRQNNEQTSAIHELLQGKLGQKGLVHHVQDLQISNTETIRLLKEGETKFNDQDKRISKLETATGENNVGQIVVTKTKIAGLLGALGLGGVVSWWEQLVNAFNHTPKQ